MQLRNKEGKCIIWTDDEMLQDNQLGMETEDGKVYNFKGAVSFALIELIKYYYY